MSGSTLASAKPGRNDPCPCGSGRKYKHCCGGAAAVEPAGELAWRRMRRLLDENNVRLENFTMDAYGPPALVEAWDQFTLIAPEGAQLTPDSPQATIFASWFRNFWSPNPFEPTGVRDRALHEVEPVRAYLERRGRRLDAPLREYLESCLEAPLSFHEVREVERGKDFVLQDLITGHEHRVTERQATEHVQAGDIVFGQVVRADGLAMLECCAPFVFPPIERIGIAKACRRLVGRRKRASFPTRDYHLEILEIYLAFADGVMQPRLPVLHNTDGDPLSLRKVVFEIESAQQAFAALRRLDPADDAELARSQRRDESGALVEATLHWVEPSSKPRGAMRNTVLGSITITARRLVVEVNSEARERRVRTLVEEALGSAARHRATEIQSMDRLLEEARSRPAKPRNLEDEKLAESPEVKALLDEHMRRYYDEWVNERIPALGNRTPLQAVRTRAGKEAVESLVLQLERDGQVMKPPLDAAIVTRLRERLGLAPDTSGR
ncbi:MAG: SEC-C metal-binding domain-containing protein [Usitatibacter sp.]